MNIVNHWTDFVKKEVSLGWNFVKQVQIIFR